jgi:hypothetical protein
MQFDISRLTEEELSVLNRQIVERLRFLQHARAQTAMQEFRIGARVAFRPAGRPALQGVLVRYNKKTVSVLTDGGEQWNVSPHLIGPPADTQDATKPERQAVFLLRK